MAPLRHSRRQLHPLGRPGIPVPLEAQGAAFDEAGRLWGLSESGTRKSLAWETRFPYIFQIDTGKLR